jgi:thiol-disulfide isomerase/thioredoxin
MMSRDSKKGLEWINTAPVSLVADLRGKVRWCTVEHHAVHEYLYAQLVLMDFWTYCCINCMHILPSLATLEDKYAQEPFAVIGVHSAKFANEKVVRVRGGSLTVLNFGLAVQQHPRSNRQVQDPASRCER